ncbi:MAG: putative 2OG-Fe(II) oxygenase [Chromatocurvus sp.]
METLHRQLQQVLSLYQRGDYANAGGYIRDTLTAYPDAADAWYMAGKVARAVGDPQAEACLRHALTLQSAHLDSLNALGGLLYDQRHLREAETCYREALAQAPDHPAVRQNLCRLLLDQGHTEPVLTLTRGLATTADAPLWRQRGEALMRIGQPQAALAAFDTSARLAPDDNRSHHGRLRALLELGRFEQVHREISSHPMPDLSFATLLIKALAGMDRWQEAVDGALDLARQQPQLPDAVFIAAQMCWTQGEAAAVEALLEQVLATRAGLGSDVMCAAIQRGMAANDRALATLAQAEQRYGPHGNIASAVVDVALEKGDTALAANAGGMAFRLDPQGTGSRLAWVQALLVNGRAAEALPLIEETPIARTNQHWLALWGDALRQLGDSRYAWLLNHQDMARVFKLTPPAGYASIEAFNRVLAARLRILHKLQVHPLDQSLKGGTQTPVDLRFIREPVIAAFRDSIQEAIARYTAALPEDDSHPLYRRRSGTAAPSGMWSVQLKPGGKHVNHVHPEGWLSSAYYVEVPPADASEPNAGALQLGQPRYATPGATAARTIAAEAGNLVLFPSYMWHGTVPANTGSRLSIAFDVTPQDEWQ